VEVADVAVKLRKIKLPDLVLRGWHNLCGFIDWMLDLFKGHRAASKLIMSWLEGWCSLKRVLAGVCWGIHW